jgi:hypothetical protein
MSPPVGRNTKAVNDTKLIVENESVSIMKTEMDETEREDGSDRGGKRQQGGGERERWWASV